MRAHVATLTASTGAGTDCCTALLTCFMISDCYVVQGTLRLTCSARTCEVYEQRDTSTSYASTVRGKPYEGLYQHDIALPRAHRAVLRLLSLQQPGSVKFQSMELLPLLPDARQHAPAADLNTGRSERDHTESESTRSQKAQVAAMLQTMMASGLAPSCR